MGYSARKNIVTDGLIFSVDANNKLGGNTASTNNLVDPSEVGTFVNGVSVVDGSFNFDGVDDRINTTLQQNLDYVTLSIWFNTESFSTLQHLSGYNVIASEYPFWFYVRNTGNIQALMRTSGLVDSDIQTSIQLNTWYNAVMTFDGSTHKLYLDGVFIDSNSISGVLQKTSGVMTIGTATIGAWPVNGKISSVKIYNKALTQSEITQNYEALKHRFE